MNSPYRNIDSPCAPVEVGYISGSADEGSSDSLSDLWRAPPRRERLDVTIVAQSPLEAMFRATLALRSNNHRFPDDPRAPASSRLRNARSRRRQRIKNPRGGGDSLRLELTGCEEDSSLLGQRRPSMSDSWGPKFTPSPPPADFLPPAAAISIPILEHGAESEHPSEALIYLIAVNLLATTFTLSPSTQQVNRYFGADAEEIWISNLRLHQQQRHIPAMGHHARNHSLAPAGPEILQEASLEDVTAEEVSHRRLLRKIDEESWNFGSLEAFLDQKAQRLDARLESLFQFPTFPMFPNATLFRCPYQSNNVAEMDGATDPNSPIAWFPTTYEPTPSKPLRPAITHPDLKSAAKTDPLRRSSVTFSPLPPAIMPSSAPPEPLDRRPKARSNPSKSHGSSDNTSSNLSPKSPPPRKFRWIPRRYARRSASNPPNDRIGSRPPSSLDKPHWDNFRTSPLSRQERFRSRHGSWPMPSTQLIPMPPPTTLSLSPAKMPKPIPKLEKHNAQHLKLVFCPDASKYLYDEVDCECGCHDHVERYNEGVDLITILRETRCERDGKEVVAPGDILSETPMAPSASRKDTAVSLERM